MSRFALVSFPTHSWGYQRPRDIWDLALDTSRIFQQNFGLGLLDSDYCPRPYQRQTSGLSEIKVSNDGNKFQVMLDVNQFSPEELSVKTVNNYVVVHGKHEEKVDEHGFVSREFTRRYLLPEGVPIESVTSSLSADGILTVEAPKPIEEAPEANVRSVPITKAASALTETKTATNVESKPKEN